jgi:hypothetical protein
VARFIPDLVQESESRVIYSGAWTRVSVLTASGGALRYTGVGGRTASTTVTDPASLGWVTTLGPDRGIAEVYVNGVLADSISLYAKAKRTKQLVYATDVLPPGTYTIEVRVTGTKNDASSGVRIDMDALVILK